MKQNCLSIECKSVKDSDLYTVDAGSYSIAQAQAVYDAYIDAGYAQFDAGADHSLDVSGEAGADIIIIWKTASPFVGEYQLRASYFAGKRVVIFPVKLDGSDDVEAVDLRVNFNSFEAGQVDLNDLTFEGSAKLYFYRQYTSMNFTGVSFKHCTCYWRRKATLEIGSLDQVMFYTRDFVDITTVQTSGVFNMEKEAGGMIGATDELTITGMASNSFVMVGKYIYIANNTTGYIHKIDAETMAAVATLDITNTHAYLATDGVTIYAADTTGRYVKKILIVDFTLVVATIDLGAGVVGGPGVCDGLNVYHASDKLYKIVISSEAVSASADDVYHIIPPTILMTNGVYAVTASRLHHKITLSDLSVSVIASPNFPFDGEAMDDNYVYYGLSAASRVIGRITLSTGAAGSIKVSDIVPLQYTGSRVLGYSVTNGTDLIVFDPATNTETVLALNNTKISISNYYDGKYLYYHAGAKLVRINYLYGLDSISAFRYMNMPDPSIILAADYLTIDLAKLRYRYYVPEGSSIDLTRLILITEFDEGTAIDDGFKRFSGGRSLVINRPDITAVLAASGTEKKIISGVMYDNDGSTPYVYSDLPMDENFYLLVTDPDGAYKYLLWYNEEIKETYYGSVEAGVEYTVVACFQLAKRNASEIDVWNVAPQANSPLGGTLEWNLSDNENVVR